MKLLVVEDKEIIRKGLRKIISDMQLPFDSIQTAPDGLVALDIFTQLKPEVVIADVRMPNMSGIEFIRRAKQLSETTKFVILSGYSEFRYARNAVRLGVSEYLLKPVRKKELNDVLNRILGEIERESVVRRNAIQNIDNRKRLDVAQCAFLEGVLKGEYRGEETGRLIEIFDGASAHYWFSSIVVASFESSFSDDVPRAFESPAGETDDIVAAYPAKIDERHAIFLLGADRRRNHYLPDLADICEAKRRMFESRGFSRAYIGASDWYRGPSAIPGTRKRAFEALDQRLVDQSNSIFLATQERHTPPATGFPIDHFSSILAATREGRRDKTDRSLESFWSYVEQLPSLAPSTIKRLAFDLVFYVMSHLYEDPGLYLELIDIEMLCRRSATLEDFKRELRGKLISLSKQIRNTSSSVIDPVGHVTSFIDTNYHRDLGLEMLSSLVSMNSNYFCTLFRKKTGRSLVQYLQQIRIEKARYYLADSSLRIVDVALEVGFNDDKYFHKIFKKVTGMTPAQYRSELYASTTEVNEGGTTQIAR